MLPIEAAHTGSGPAIVQLAPGLTVTVFEQTPGQPSRVILSVTVNVVVQLVELCQQLLV